jgi:hypothetical protein
MQTTQSTAAKLWGRCITSFSLIFLSLTCAAQNAQHPQAAGDFGVLVMAHGGPVEWNQSILAAVKPLQDNYNVEIAFGMADSATLQDGIRRLEMRGARRIGVVRLFISGESWNERTEQILGLTAGAPTPPAATGHDHSAHHGHGGHDMGFWKIETRASFALSTQGLAEATEMGRIIAERAKTLSRKPEIEDVLILAHGPGDDAENERWLVHLEARADVIRTELPFRRVRVETLREDWPEKRADAERRVRAFVENAADNGGRAIVIPLRVQGFGPYAKVLHDLDYISDGLGLLPHPYVTNWIEDQIKALEAGPFRTPIGSTAAAK